MIFLKRNRKEQPVWLRYVIALVVGFGFYLGLSLLTANLILNETVPEAIAPVGLCASAAIAAFASGLIAGSRGGHKPVQGLVVGAAIAIFVLIVKGICNQEAECTLYTTIAVTLCVVCGALSSCIFHKRNKKTSRRKKKNAVSK